MLHQRLRESTSAQHQALEKTMVLKIRKISVLRDYADLLKIMYGFYAPLEQRIEEFIPADAGLRMDSRRKASALLRDLTVMGVIGEVPVCKKLPAVSGYPQALGALYVLEGSTLGGRVISEMIGRQLGAPVENALGFFRGYGEKTVEMWEEFKRQLLRPLREDDQVSAIGSANDTFLTFKQWIEENDQPEL